MIYFVDGLLWVIALGLGLIAASRSRALLLSSIREGAVDCVRLLPRIMLGVVGSGYIAALLPQEVVGRLLGADSGVTGLCIAVPPGFEAQVRPRSGLALKNGVTCLNAPGTVDSDYRGEVSVLLINHGEAPFTVRRGDRIAQMVIARYERAVWQEEDSLDETGRGRGGFGSTGGR